MIVVGSLRNLQAAPKKARTDAKIEKNRSQETPRRYPRPSFHRDALMITNTNQRFESQPERKLTKLNAERPRVNLRKAPRPPAPADTPGTKDAGRLHCRQMQNPLYRSEE